MEGRILPWAGLRCGNGKNGEEVSGELETESKNLD
jgi:hypothetical protein